MPATSSASSRSKYSVRAWMAQRQRERSPLPELAQIRRQLDAMPCAAQGANQTHDVPLARVAAPSSQLAG